MTTLADLHAEIDFLQQHQLTAAYKDKQLTALPEIPLIDREPYLEARCRDQRVLNLGSASGQLHERLKIVAASVIGIDHEPGPHTDAWLDLDDYEALKHWEPPAVDVIVMGEILEHLCNPGYCLRRLTALRVPLILTTPNAFSRNYVSWLRHGYENTNRDHVGLHSYVTLSGLLRKCGWTPVAWAQYLSSLPHAVLPGFLGDALPAAFRPHLPPYAEGWIVAATPTL